MITVYKISHIFPRKLQIQLEKQSSFNASLKNPNPNSFICNYKRPMSISYGRLMIYERSHKGQ